MLVRLQYSIISILLASLVSGCDGTSTTPRISKSEGNVDGFDLVFDDSKARSLSGLLEVGYAIKANYQYFTYRGEIYRSVGGGSVVIKPLAVSPARFEVRESVISVEDDGSVRTSLLQVFDKRSSKELARRGLDSRAVENGTGWTGDHAVKFVRAVLRSSSTPDRPWGVKDYPTAEAHVTVEEPKASSLEASSMQIKNCSSEFSIKRRGARSTLRGPGFEFMPKHPLNLVACDSKYVLVASGVFGQDFNIDLLTIEGIHLAQAYVHLPLAIESRWQSLTPSFLDPDHIEVTLLSNRGVDNSDTKTLRIKASLGCRSETECARNQPR